jgi:hypothetical protein
MRATIAVMAAVGLLLAFGQQGVAPDLDEPDAR